ncbi:hypothetical protein [Streptomyces sp. NPDC053720]|uniref:hypothetical protein n=1 Tax=Streptomyces sp. NPDC053720 TaxID=3154855 RepID=UPI00343E2D64
MRPRRGFLVELLMDPLPPPPVTVADLADEISVLACLLADQVATVGWSGEAAGDATDAVEILLGALGPEQTAPLLARFLRTPADEPPVPEPTPVPIRVPRSRRRGLGDRWRGLPDSLTGKPDGQGVA